MARNDEYAHQAADTYNKTFSKYARGAGTAAQIAAEGPFREAVFAGISRPLSLAQQDLVFDHAKHAVERDGSNWSPDTFGYWATLAEEIQRVLSLIEGFNVLGR